MILSVCLIILFVLTILGLGAAENNLLNQKMTSALKAQEIAFNSAEAGLMAGEEKINGGDLDLSDIGGKVSYEITTDTVNMCQQHIFGLSATAVYQNVTVTLVSGYLQTHQPPLPGCANDSNHRLWWSEL